jgi:hypothetical protein
MKAHQSSSSFIVILLVMSVFNLSLNVLAAHQDNTAATLRGNAVVGQGHRMLPPGGNGGGGGGNGGGGKNKTPAPTNASTPAPTNASTPEPTNASTPEPTNASTPAPTNASTPRPTQGYPIVPWNSCGTRPPVTTPSPTPPTPPTCVNPGQCHSKNNPCCPGFECSGGKTKTCVAVRRNLRVEQPKPFPFQTSGADASHRKLNQCGLDPDKDSCNEFNNPILCEVNGDIPSNAKDTPSIICNYADNAEYKAGVDPCDSNFCCEDGNGGYYSPASCWNTEWQCCPKGYTKNLYGNSCIPMNCCDGDDDHRALYCPNC